MATEINQKKVPESLLNEVADSRLPVAETEQNEVLDLGNSFNFNDFQVVRREFFAHMHEPSATFNNYKFSVNNACLQKFPDASSVQVLINQDTKIMALMPCPDDAKDSFSWCRTVNGKRSPKPVICKLFFAKVFAMMNWNPDYRYKLLGRLIRANGQMLIAFDLKATEIYQRIIREGAKPRTSRTPIFPSEWQNQFGLPYNEHRKSMQISIFDGYAIYAVKDSTQSTPSQEQEETALQRPSTPMLQ